jgi:nitrogen fixation NifU-like protein
VGPLASVTHTVRVDNPLCGDRVTLELQVEEGTISGLRHKTRGCALCIASASVMGDLVTGCSTADTLARAQGVTTALDPTGDGTLSDLDAALSVVVELFSGVEKAPARKVCVALPWQALVQAL